MKCLLSACLLGFRLGVNILFIQIYIYTPINRVTHKSEFLMTTINLKFFTLPYLLYTTFSSSPSPSLLYPSFSSLLFLLFFTFTFSSLPAPSLLYPSFSSLPFLLVFTLPSLLYLYFSSLPFYLSLPFLLFFALPSLLCPSFSSLPFLLFFTLPSLYYSSISSCSQCSNMVYSDLRGFISLQREH